MFQLILDFQKKELNILLKIQKQNVLLHQLNLKDDLWIPSGVQSIQSLIILINTINCKCIKLSVQ